MTSAALILFLAFVAMSTAPSSGLKMMATGLGAGILLDATLIRSALVPALVSLLAAGLVAPPWLASALRVPARAMEGPR